MAYFFLIPDGWDLHKLAEAFKRLDFPDPNYDGAYGPYWYEDQEKYQLDCGNDYWLRVNTPVVIRIACRYKAQAPNPNAEPDRDQRRMARYLKLMIDNGFIEVKN